MRHVKERLDIGSSVPVDAGGSEIPASLLLDSTVDSIFVYRFDDGEIPCVIYANRSAAESRGYSREEIIGHPLTDIMDPSQDEVLHEKLAVLREQGRVTFQTVHRRKDGTTFPVEVRAALFEFEEETISISVVRDISEWVSLRSELDEALQRALTERSQLRTMMDVMPVGMALVGTNAAVLEVNKANEEVWRTAKHPRPQEIDSYSVFKGWDPQTGEPYGPRDWPVAEVLKTKEAVQDRLVTIERFDGTRGMVEISAIPVPDSQGNIESIVVLTVDVTDRERRERLTLALDDLNLEIHSTFDRDRILDSIMKTTLDAYEADYAIVMRIEGDSCVRDRAIGMPHELGADVPYRQCTHALHAAKSKRPLFAEDVAHSGFVAQEAVDAGIGALVVIPMVVFEDTLFVIELGFKSPRRFDHSDVDFARKTGDFGSFALDNARLYRELERSVEALAEKDVAIRSAYSDVIEAVTGGRLIILGSDELDAAIMEPSGPRRLIDDPSQLGVARREAREQLGQFPFADDLVLAFGEALNNALKHAGEACYGFKTDSAKVQIVVSDPGPGIDFSNLPKATLVSGFSTKNTLGVGFTLMMELTDRIMLCTDASGTTLVLERDLSDTEARI